MSPNPIIPVEALLKEKQISQVTDPKVVHGPSRTTIREAIAMMQDQKSGYIVIADDGAVVGVFTETDVARKLLGRSVDWDQPITTIMTKDPLVLKPTDTIGSAIALMGQHHIYHLPLVDENNKLTNVLSVRSLIRLLAEFYPEEVFNLPPDPGQITETAEGG